MSFFKNENCNDCRNKHTCMCDNCNKRRILKGNENHHTNNYLDINRNPRFLDSNRSKKKSWW